MSYIKNCKTCGQKISLREMQRGQWVAFDANTDIPHKHNKKNKAQKRPNYDLKNSVGSSQHINTLSSQSQPYTTTNSASNSTNIWPYIIIGIIIIIIISN